MNLRGVTSLVALASVVAQPAMSAQTQACRPDSTAQTHMARVQRDLAATPSDPVHLFRLAVDRAALCQDDEALQVLERIADQPGGLDPSGYRPLQRLRWTARFLAVVAKVRQLNPPVIASTTAYTLARPGLFPEGMAFDSASNRVYAGSTSRRQIVWTDATGSVRDLVEPGQDGLGAVLGLHLDARRHQLWAVSAALGRTTVPPPVSGLFEYDLTSGRLIRRYTTQDTLSQDFFNDVVVEPLTGVAYATRTPSGGVYVASPGDSVLRALVPSGSVPFANGITLSPDGSALIVAGGLGLVRIDLDTRRVSTVTRAPGVVDVTIDGLYRHGGSLIGIQNGVHPGRVLRFDLDSSFTRVTRMTVLESYNPIFDGVTTGAVSGNVFYFMANPRQGRPLLVPSSADAPGPDPVRIQRLQLDDASAAAPDTSWNDQFPQWSPDGRSIVFSSDRSGDIEIYTMRADGSGLARLTQSPGRDAHPSFSHDGRRIVFQSPRENGEDTNLYLMNDDGSGVRQLTHLKGFAGVPVFSAGDSLIVFQWRRSNDFQDSEKWRIMLVRADGTDVRELTSGSFNDQVPRWSRDGTRLLFFSDRTGKDQIYTMNIRGGDVRRLLSSAFNDRDGSWSPDERRELFTSDRDGNVELYVADTDGRNVVRLTRTRATERLAVWSPDGRRVLFASDGDGPSRVFIMNADGTGLAMLGRIRRLQLADDRFMLTVTNSMEHPMTLSYRVAGDTTSHVLGRVAPSSTADFAITGQEGQQITVTGEDTSGVMLAAVWRDVTLRRGFALRVDF